MQLSHAYDWDNLVLESPHAFGNIMSPSVSTMKEGTGIGPNSTMSAGFFCWDFLTITGTKCRWLLDQRIPAEGKQ